MLIMMKKSRNPDFKIWLMILCARRGQETTARADVNGEMAVRPPLRHKDVGGFDSYARP